MTAQDKFQVLAHSLRQPPSLERANPFQLMIVNQGDDIGALFITGESYKHCLFHGRNPCRPIIIGCFHVNGAVLSPRLNCNKSGINDADASCYALLLQHISMIANQGFRQQKCSPV